MSYWRPRTHHLLRAGDLGNARLSWGRVLVAGAAPHALGFEQQRLRRLDSDRAQRQSQSDASQESLCEPPRPVRTPWVPYPFVGSSPRAFPHPPLAPVEAHGCFAHARGLGPVARGPCRVCSVHFWTARPCVHRRAKASALGPRAVKPSSSLAEAERVSMFKKPGCTAENVLDSTVSWRFISPRAGHSGF